MRGDSEHRRNGKEKMYDKHLDIIVNDRFISKLYYATPNNIAKKNLYQEFCISDQILVHHNLAIKIIKLIPVLKKLNMKLLITDAFRPLEIQKYLYDNWERLTNQKPSISLASIENSPHPRCIALDVVPADENGEKLNLPSSSINVNPEQRKPDYIFEKSPDGLEKERNRNLLRTLMLCVGISPINKEWFHFQLPDAQLYQIINISDAKKANIITNFINQDLHYYDIFNSYWEEHSLDKNNYWIFNSNYFKSKQQVDFNVFMDKIGYYYGQNY
jgi:D-alanyl-D-alanine dipeptidase